MSQGDGGRSNFLRLEVASQAENIGLVRVAVAAFAAQDDLTLDQLEEIKVATSEAVTNAIVHGYGKQRDRVVRVEVTRWPGALEITVSDDGVGIADVEQAMQPAFSTDPERMGLGFAFMQSFMDSVEVRSRPGEGTTVIMRRQLAPPPAAREN